jgi:alkanesulfonate monooxygenase SsuD/methylene tetrahydromethanopterin reductase-like flavin-dependent oxidoreductase (luciferase family)
MAPGVGRNVPIVVGGISDFALRRTARIGDGWAPAYLPIEGIRQGIEKIREYQKEYGREGAELRVYTSAIDAVEADGYERLEEIGVTHTTSTPWINFDGDRDFAQMVKGVPLETILDGIKRFSDDVIAKLR